jgi:hypothetical protein
MTRDDIIAQVQRNITFGMVPDGYRPDPAQLWPYSLSGSAESYGAESPSRVSPAQARAYGGTSRGGGGFPFPLLGGAPGEYPEYEEYAEEAWNSAENAGEASGENSTSLSDLVAKARELYNKTVSRSAESDRKFEPEITAKGKDLGENRAKPQEAGGTGSPEARETEARKLGELVDHGQLKGLDSRLVDQIKARDRIDITQEYPEAQRITYSDQVDTVSGADEKYRERLDISQTYPEATKLVESNQLDAITGADRTLLDSTKIYNRQSGAGRSFELRPGAKEQLIDRRNVFQRAFDAMGNYMASENEKNLASPGRFVATEIVPYGLAAPLIGGAASLGAGAIASAPLTAPVMREASNVINFAQAAQKLAPVTAPAAASSSGNVINIADYLGKGISAAASVVGGALVGARQSAGWDSSKMQYTAPKKTTADPMKSVADKMLKSLGGK